MTVVAHPFHQVEVQVDAVDKAGNFIGWMFVQDTNLSVALVEVRFVSLSQLVSSFNTFNVLLILLVPVHSAGVQIMKILLNL